MSEILTFHWADYFVFAIFLAFSTAIGVIFGYRSRKNLTAKEYLTGGGQMHWVPVALSMQASFLSAVFILSIPTEVYNFGTLYYYLLISYFVAMPISGHLYMPIFYKLRLISAYEYLERRFNSTVRCAGSLTFCFMVLLYMSVVLYTPSIAIAQVTGLSVSLAIIVCGTVCTLYTVIGGMKATIWNDFFQMIIIIVGLLCIIILGAIRLGGMDEVWRINQEGGRIIFDEFRLDPTIRSSFWTHSVGGSVMTLTLYASNQTVIQKYNSVDTLRNAKKSMWLASITSTLFLTLVVLVGLICYAFYAQCDPLASGKITKLDQIVPLLVMEVMGELHGLPGLFIATAFSAALSSISGSLNSLSAVTLTDFIRPIYFKTKGKALEERTSAILTRVLTVIFGVFTIGMGFVAQFLGDFVLQITLSIFGFVGGPLTSLLTLGIFLPFVNSWGALAGLLSSLGVTSWVAIGAIVWKNPLNKLAISTDGCHVGDHYNSVNATDATWSNLTTTTTTATRWTELTSLSDVSAPVEPDILWVYKISYMYYSLVAMVVAVVVAIVVSLITGIARDTDPNLTFRWFRRCCCCCPRQAKNCLRCTTKSDDSDEYENCSGEEEKPRSTGLDGMNDVIFDNQYDIVLDLKKEEPSGGGLHNGLNCTGDGEANMGDRIGGHVEKTARKSELA